MFNGGIIPVMASLSKPDPPTRTIALKREKVKMDALCDAGCQNFGRLKCNNCFATCYCSAECQKKSWKKHKPLCKKIKDLNEELKKTERCLLLPFTSDRGERTVEKFLQSSSVREGTFFRWFTWDHSYEGEFMSMPKSERTKSAFHPIRVLTSRDMYFKNRRELISAYLEVGFNSIDETQVLHHGHFGQMAFRLAGLNNLDLLCLTYSSPTTQGSKGVHYHLRTAGYLIAGGMHQEALNLLVYLEQRRLFMPALPYLSLPNVDIDSDEYIKWFTQKRNGKNKIKRYLDETPYWRHSYMMLALIKFKRIQELCIQRKKVDAQVTSFLMGTHLNAGHDSPVKSMRRDVYAIKAITDLFNIDSFKMKIQNLIQQVSR